MYLKNVLLLCVLRESTRGMLLATTLTTKATVATTPGNRSESGGGGGFWCSINEGGEGRRYSCFPSPNNRSVDCTRGRKGRRTVPRSLPPPPPEAGI